MPGSRLFAAIYDRCSGGAEGYMAPRREFVAGSAKGKVLEIGAGTGGNLPYYPEGVDLTLTDLSPHMLKRLKSHAEEKGFISPLKERATSSPLLPLRDGYSAKPGAEVKDENIARITVVLARAESLPFEDGSFDTVTGTLVLCSVRDQPKALSEIRRVLRPGGEFRFFEHVRSEGRCWSMFQRAVKPLWGVIGDGCDPARNTVAGIRAAGFEVVELKASKFGPYPVRPHVMGVAGRS